MSPSALRLPFELFRLIGGYERVDYRVKVAVKDALDIEVSHVADKTVVGHAVLREVICAYPIRTVAGADLAFALGGYGGGLLLLFLMLFAAHWLGIYTIPALSALGQTRPWMYIGGLIGTALVIGSIVIPKKIGFTAYFSMLVAGQLVGSVIADAIGFLGNPVHLPGPARIFGVICLIAGAVLVQKK